jgi:hypothetical protein
MEAQILLAKPRRQPPKNEAFFLKECKKMAMSCNLLFYVTRQGTPVFTLCSQKLTENMTASAGAPITLTRLTESWFLGSSLYQRFRFNT